MLKFNNITKKFRNDFWDKSFYALSNVSFEIEPGKITGFLGSNGAGKTTSIKIIMRFIRQNSGFIKYNSSLGKNWSEILSNVGYFPERPFFYPHLTGREFITYISKLNRLDNDIISRGIDKWSERMQIKHAIDRKIRGYSKGMLQRLGFVTTLVKTPKFLILDEPLAGLDPVGRKEFKDVMVDLNKMGTTIFFSSHIVSDVEEISSKVVVLEKGQLIHDGDIDSLIDNNLDSKYLIKCIDNQSFDFSSKFDVEMKIFGNIRTLTMDATNKDEYIKQLVDNNIQLIEVKAMRPTLEEIVYKIRK